MIIRPRVVISLTKADLSDAYIEITKPEQMSHEMFQEQVDEFCRYWLGRKWIPDEYPFTDSSQTAKADSGKLDLTYERVRRMPR